MIERSTEFIHSGELHKISKGHSQERHFFLFDHQLVYCKKVSNDQQTHAAINRVWEQDYGTHNICWIKKK